MQKILVVGTGYVGLVTGACFAEMGHKVTCLDIDEKKICQLKEGHIPIFEPGLEELVVRNRPRLEFTTDYARAVAETQVIFLALPTPENEDGSANLSYLQKAVEQIAGLMDGWRLFVNKSTVPVGTAEAVRTWVSAKTKQPFDVVSNPEFLKEGDAISDFMKPDRIIIGADSDKAIEMMRTLYSPFNFSHERVIIMDCRSAEMTKYAANAMLATRISFMNELSVLCEELGVDIDRVRLGIGSDRRIGMSFLYPGCGFGGSCFPKDIKALIQMGKQVPMSIIEAVELANERQKRRLFDKMARHFGSLKGKVIAVWGLSFKPGTDDMRKAPSLTLIQLLQEAGATVRAYDPVAKPKLDVTFCNSELEAADGADAIALVTEWKPFRLVDMEEVKKRMRGNAFFDGRNQYRPTHMRELGFTYFSIGRP